MNVKNLILYYCVVSPILFLIVVVVFGAFVPEYNHFRDTISILAIRQYGWVQLINFIQIGFGIFFCGYFFYKKLTLPNSKTVWRNIVLFCLVFLIIEMFFPTDDITGNNILNNIRTTRGAIHFGALAIFFLAAPFGIYTLKKTLTLEPGMQTLSKITGYLGYIATLLSYLWTFFFVNGMFYQYSGLLQKLIVFITLIWVECIALINRK
jgi:hypothetical protein